MRKVAWSYAALAAGWVISLSAAPAMGAIPPYQLVGQFAAPSGPFDVLPDGRVLFLSGNQFLAADVRSASAAQVLGSVDGAAISSFGASFVSVSPDGSTIAFGDNNFGPGARVHLLATASLSSGGPSSTRSAAAPNAEAVWTGGSTLFVSGFGSGPVVTRIDAATLETRTVIANIGEGTGGVANDGTHLYVGLGYDGPSGTRTGEIRAFDLASVEAAGLPGGGGGAALDFFGGTLVGKALSGSSLGFDANGHLLAGGGDFLAGGDAGSAAVLDRAGIERALAGGPIDAIGAQLRLAPAGPFGFYSIKFDRPTGELLVSDGTTIFRYAVPAPGAGAMVISAGLLASRRRRHG